MWIYTKEGFFSVVEDKKYCKEDEVMVRARIKLDLQRFKDHITTDPDIVTLNEADYLHRIPVKRVDWANYLHKSAMELDYSTVKDSIGNDGKRGIYYYGVWRNMQKLQDKMMMVEGTWGDCLPVYDPDKHGV